MKYCSKCGKEVMDEAVVCVHCGCALANSQPAQAPAAQTQQEETAKLATAAMVCAVLIPIAGLILGIVGISKYKNPVFRKKCTTAIIVSIVVWILAAVLLSMV